MTSENAQSENAQVDFVITRVLDAPREIVWRAWTEADQWEKWWGPKGSAIEVLQCDVRPGGVCHYAMSTPDGNKTWGRFDYRELAAPSLMVFTGGFADESGDIIRAPFSENFPLQILTTRTLEEVAGGKTKLTLHAAPLDATPAEREFFASMHDSMRDGFNGTFEKLAEFLAQNDSA